METVILVLIALGAGAYIYYSLFKKKGCNCSGGGSCASKKPKQP
ncbi:FeoB-associated Cys-rich membrane protein [Sulfurospirillum sp. T05]|uniref:FeoB-associated Cys-rich membrane protein n=1 Tax=Sulfurospirillum tamanense TaxID=2813362 RepID=A0ABS2WRW7_9BACT|nr:FeoB-associated Cys-rich membrane protein [Sulfurospirillum tamanensis]MBN2964409.1 FeoB-associated Cys-rich membrane protein [Sulfurospirillum tamanensis]